MGKTPGREAAITEQGQSLLPAVSHCPAQMETIGCPISPHEPAGDAGGARGPRERYKPGRKEERTQRTDEAAIRKSRQAPPAEANNDGGCKAAR